MRGSLRGVQARIDRLQARVQPSAEEMEAKLSAMSDGTLEAFWARAAEDAVGPAETFATVGAFLDALRTAEHLDPEEDAIVLAIAHDHWVRLHWFRDHAPHGVTFVSHWCVRPRPEWLWGPGVIASCRCGATLEMFRPVVPPAFRHLLPADERDPSQWKTS